MKKEALLNKLCYTERAYTRINKKLSIDLSKKEIEQFIDRLINETPPGHFQRKGKNIYISHPSEKIRICINSNTVRVITVDRLHH